MAFTKLLYHIVFSTKKRAPVIDPEWEGRLHAFLGGIVNDLDGWPVCINGWFDHVHILCELHQSIAVPEVVQNLKARSSLWLNEEKIPRAHFKWQVK